jgi:hypothetical protein
MLAAGIFPTLLSGAPYVGVQMTAFELYKDNASLVFGPYIPYQAHNEQDQAILTRIHAILTQIHAILTLTHAILTLNRANSTSYPSSAAELWRA